jgi:hypothetical protein
VGLQISQKEELKGPVLSTIKSAVMDLNTSGYEGKIQVTVLSCNT